jgi:hypothetical protein
VFSAHVAVTDVVFVDVSVRAGAGGAEGSASGLVGA